MTDRLDSWRWTLSDGPDVGPNAPLRFAGVNLNAMLAAQEGDAWAYQRLRARHADDIGADSLEHLRGACARALEDPHVAGIGAARLVDWLASPHAHGYMVDELAPLVLGADSEAPVREALASHVRASIGAIASRARVRPVLDDPGKLATWLAPSRGMLALDHALAAVIGKLDPKGPARASYVEKARAALETRGLGCLDRWINPAAEPFGAPWLPRLAKLVWEARTRPELKRRRDNVPALVAPIHEQAVRAHSRAFVLEDRAGQLAMVFDRSAPIILAPTTSTIAALDASAVRELVHQGAKLLGSVLAHKLLRWEVQTGHARAMAGEPDARVLRVDGSWEYFAAEVLGERKKDAYARLRAIAWAQDAVRLVGPDGSHGRLATLAEHAGAGRRRGSIEIQLGTALLPFYGNTVAGEPGASAEWQRLVPVPASLPPMVGKRTQHGALATLAMLAMAELRARARDLATRGAVEITPERWASLAADAGLDRATLAKALDRWTQDGPDAPAYLTRPYSGAWSLAPAYAAELAFITRAGEVSEASSRRGRASARKRASATRRKG